MPLSDFYLAVGANSLIVRSTDGITWTQVNRDAVHPIGIVNIVTDGVTTWMCSGHENYLNPGGRMYRSIDDGVTWSVELPAPFNYDTTYGPPLPITQQNYDVPSVHDQNSLGMLWDGTNFQTAGIATSTYHLSSPDGLTATWTKNLLADFIVTNGFYSYLYSPVTGNYFGLFNRTGGGGDNLSHFVVSTDMGQTGWNDVATCPGHLSNPYMAINGSVIVVFGMTSSNGSTNGTYVSTDGGATFNYHANQIILNSIAQSVLFDTVTNRWIVVGFNGLTQEQGIFTSTDNCVTFTGVQTDLTQTAPSLLSICRTVPGAGNLAVTGDSGVFFTSTDAVTWTEVGTQWESPDHIVDNKWLFHQADYYITYQFDALGDNIMATSADGLSTNWANQYQPEDPIFQFIGPSQAVVTAADDTILMMREVTGGRLSSPFTRLNGFPTTFFGIRQVYNPQSTSQEDSFIILALGADGNAYQLFGGTQDGTVTATAVTQPLPTLEDIEGALWDTQKIFRTLYVEAVDINNWTVSYSVDGGTTYPWGPFPLTQRQQVGVDGKQLTVKFVHSVACLAGVTPQITYIKLDYDIAAGQIQGNQ